MIARLGVSIHAHELRAVLVRGRKVQWSAALDRSDADAGRGSIVELLDSLPRHLGPRRATVALGLEWCQLKRIDGLPASKDVAVLSRLVRENVDSFFLRHGNRGAASDVVRHADATTWAAWFDEDVATAAIAALRKRGFTKVRVVPSVVVIASVVPAGAHRWGDGDGVVEITTAVDGSIRELRRVVAEDGVSLIQLPAALASLGDDAWRAAAAYGAALTPRNAAFTWHPGPDPRRIARRARVSFGVTAVIAAMSALGALVAPGVRAARATRLASTQLAALRTLQTEAARAQAELSRSVATLDRVERFREARGRTTLLLGALSQVLPESTALVSLRVDTLDGTFVALAPHAAEILPQLEGVVDIVSPRIVGSLTKETVAGVQLERATVRFRRVRGVETNTSKPAARGRT